MASALAIAAICTAVQAGNGVHHLRHAVPWKHVGISFVVRGAATCLGTWALRVLVNYPVSRIKSCIGGIADRGKLLRVGITGDGLRLAGVDRGEFHVPPDYGVGEGIPSGCQ